MAYKDPQDPRLRAARRKHYYNNKEQYLLNNKIKRRKMREFLNKVKDVPCMDCKQLFPPYCMDFDHRDMNDKIMKLTSLTNCGSWRKLNEEIKKCDIVCANCHRIRTAKQLVWCSGNKSPSKSD